MLNHYEKKLRRRKRKKRSPGHLYRAAYLNHLNSTPARTSKTETLNAPGNFSIVENCEQMTEFFKKLNRQLKQGKRVFLNLRGIKSLTPDAIIYMLHQFEYYELKYGQTLISGNYPDNEAAKGLLEQSGFLEQIGSARSFKTKQNSGAVFAIENGTQVETPIASRLAKFTRDQLSITRGKVSSSVYTTLIESMANTHNHAFIKGRNRLPKWFVLAQYSPHNNVVEFAFLDGGAGIPYTIRMNYAEKVRKLLGNIMGTTDARLVISALEGEFRSRTQEANRGKGLPHIKKMHEIGNISNLVIISNKAYLRPREQNPKELENKFYGTLICWKVRSNMIGSHQ